jgi:hypothetical protein
VEEYEKMKERAAVMECMPTPENNTIGRELDSEPCAIENRGSEQLSRSENKKMIAQRQSSRSNR